MGETGVATVEETVGAKVMNQEVEDFVFYVISEPPVSIEAEYMRGLCGANSILSVVRSLSKGDREKRSMKDNSRRSIK